MFHRGINKYRYKRRDLPHWDIPGVTQAMTYRLWDSIPQSEAQKIKTSVANSHADIQDYAMRRLTESCLNRGFGSGILKYPEIAKIVLNNWLYNNGKAYDLYEWVIMPNHIHLLFCPYPGYTLRDIVTSWKSYTSHLIRQTDIYRQAVKDYPDDMKQSVWSLDYFDRAVRSSTHYSKMKKYIYNNPVGLLWDGKVVSKPEDWPFSSASTGWQKYL